MHKPLDLLTTQWNNVSTLSMHMQQNKNAKEKKIQTNLNNVAHASLVFFLKKNRQHNKVFFNKDPRKSNPIPIND
jgi:uncharacterized protein YihD (DUF1040 family)